MRVAGVDVGGSGVRAGLHPGGDIHRVELTDRGLDSVLGAVQRALAPLGALDGVGVAVPGFLKDGCVLASPNFPSWQDVALGQVLEERLGVPVVIENDATAAALGAFASRGATEDLVLLTLGTGVGGGVVLSGEPIRGRTGSAAELGHIFAGGDQACGCGASGCLETWVSASGWRSRTGRPDLVADEVVAGAVANEGWALDLLEGAGLALGRAARSITNSFDPDVILLAGGLTVAKDWLAPGLTEGLRQAARPMAERVQVVWLGRADELAIAGARRSALSRLPACGDLPA